jgi:glycosyltransferase involved in cell wall biosynthesis
VTNDFLKSLVERKGGRAFVLHDKIPDIGPPQKKLDLPTGTNVLFVCTYAADEPYQEVIAAARRLPNDCHIHITGNFRKAGLEPTSSDMPSNVHLLGFVSSKDYDAYMLSCDVIMVLTTSEWVIVCGGYEAAAAMKPLITSNTDTLSEFYQGYAYHTASTPEAIAEAISEVCSKIQVYRARMCAFSELESKQWERQWSCFLKKVATL